MVSPYTLSSQICLGTSVSHLLSSAGTLNYQGSFPVERRLKPSEAELKVVLYGHRAQLPGSKSQNGPTTVSMVLPKGSSWWKQSKPSQGIWIYSDPKGLKSAVRSLIISQPPKQVNHKQQPTKITLVAADRKLKQLVGAQSYRLDFEFLKDRQRLSSLARGTRLDLPPRNLLPDEKTGHGPDRNPNDAQ